MSREGLGSAGCTQGPSIRRRVRQRGRRAGACLRSPWQAVDRCRAGDTGRWTGGVPLPSSRGRGNQRLDALRTPRRAHQDGAGHADGTRGAAGLRHLRPHRSGQRPSPGPRSDSSLVRETPSRVAIGSRPDGRRLCRHEAAPGGSSRFRCGKRCPIRKPKPAAEAVREVRARASQEEGPTELRALTATITGRKYPRPRRPKVRQPARPSPGCSPDQGHEYGERPTARWPRCSRSAGGRSRSLPRPPACRASHAPRFAAPTVSFGAPQTIGIGGAG